MGRTSEHGQSCGEALLWESEKAARLVGWGGQGAEVQFLGHAGREKAGVCVCKGVAPPSRTGLSERAGAVAAALPGGAVAGRCPNCIVMQRSLSRGNLWQCSISGQGKP